MESKKKTIFRILFFVGFVFCVVLVWGSSLVPGKESAEQSGAVTDAIISIGSNTGQSEIKPVLPTSIEASDMHITVGSVVVIDAKVLPEDTTDKSVVISIADKTVAMLDYKTVTALKVGNTTITISSKANPNITKTINLIITKSATIMPTEISISSNSINVDDSSAITINVFPANASIKDFIWLSSNNSVLQVKEFNESMVYLSGINIGNAQLIARSKSTNCEFTFDFGVLEVLCSEIKLIENFDLSRDGKFNIEYIPSSTTNKQVTYQSSNTNVLEVDEDGNYTLTGYGTTDITIALVANEEIKIVKTINISNPAATYLEVEDIVVVVGNQFCFMPTFKPSFIVGEDLVVPTSSLYEKDDDVFKAISVGEEEITVALASDSTITTKVLVRVLEEGTILPTSVTINDFISTMEIGTTQKLDVSLLPNDAVDTTVLFKSSNKEVATIDEDGNIIALSVGKTTITAYSKYLNSVKATITFSVTAIAVSTIDILLDNSYVLGEMVDIKYSLYPNQAVATEISYSVDKPEIAKINNDQISFIGLGEVTLNVTINGVSKSKTIKIEKKSISINIPSEINIDSELQMEYSIFDNIINLDISLYELRLTNIKYVTGNTVKATKLGKVTIELLYLDEIIGYGESEVVDYEIEKIQIIGLNEVECGKRYRYDYEVFPHEVRNDQITWEVDNPSIAEITETGELLGIAKGTVTITIRSKANIEVIDQLVVNVNWIIPTAISFEIDKMSVGDSLQINVTSSPQLITNMTLIWTTSNENVIISDDGTITAVKSGDVELSATLKEDPNVTYSLTLKVTNKNSFSKIDLALLYRLVRKGIGHFGAFFVLGFCLFMWLLLKKKNQKMWILLVSIPSVFVIAAISELLQLIPDGRVCTMNDVIIDFCGSICAICLLFIIYIIIFIIKKIKLRSKKGELL